MDPEEWKQDLDGLYIDLSEEKFVGEAEEDLGQITGTLIKGSTAEKGEHKTSRAAQRCFYDLQVLEVLTRYKDPQLQHVCPTQIALARYELWDASKGGLGIGLSMPEEVSDCMEDGPVRVHDRHGFWFD